MWVDGSTARAGGWQRMNDARNTGRSPSACIYPDGVVAMDPQSTGIPLRNDMSAAQMAAAEVLTSYGERFWDAMATRANALEVAAALLHPKQVARVWLFDANGDPSDPSVLLLRRRAVATSPGHELYGVPCSTLDGATEAPSHHAQRTLRASTGVRLPLSGLAEVRVRSGDGGALHDYVATATRSEAAAAVNAQSNRFSQLEWVPMSQLEAFADHDVFDDLKEHSREALWKARTTGQMSGLW